MLDERRDVGQPIAQRRDPQRVDVEPVVEILPEAAGLDLALEIAIRGRDDARGDGMARSPPTRVTFRSSSTRSSLACAGSGSSPTSSRNSVPPAAFSNAPRRSRSAPVNAPRSWPNNSLSTSCSGNAALFTATSGVFAPGPSRCSSRATSSLPVPLSPTISTLLGIGATRAIASRSARIGALSPMSDVSPSKRDRSVRSSFTSRPRDTAFSISWTTRSIGSALSTNP